MAHEADSRLQLRANRLDAVLDHNPVRGSGHRPLWAACMRGVRPDAVPAVRDAPLISDSDQRKGHCLGVVRIAPEVHVRRDRLLLAEPLARERRCVSRTCLTVRGCEDACPDSLHNTYDERTCTVDAAIAKSASEIQVLEARGTQPHYDL